MRTRKEKQVLEHRRRPPSPRRAKLAGGTRLQPERCWRGRSFRREGHRAPDGAPAPALRTQVRRALDKSSQLSSLHGEKPAIPASLTAVSQNQQAANHSERIIHARSSPGASEAEEQSGGKCQRLCGYFKPLITSNQLQLGN